MTAAVEARHLESTLLSDAPRTDLQDIGDDRRSIAEVLARHLEHADVVAQLQAGVPRAVASTDAEGEAAWTGWPDPFTDWLDGIPRSKGALWLATRPDICGTWTLKPFAPDWTRHC